MWRKDVAGKTCTFIGADDNAVSALKECFGWIESGRINKLGDISALTQNSSAGRNINDHIIAICLFNQVTKSPSQLCSIRTDLSMNFWTTVQTVVSQQNQPSATVLYFVEESAHTRQTLLKAIESGANAYFTCALDNPNRTMMLSMKLIYSEYGVTLDRQLALPTVFSAQNLTPIQTRIMHCLRSDILTDKEIALNLGISERMVGKIIGQLFEIFNCNRRSALVKQSIHMQQSLNTKLIRTPRSSNIQV